MKILGRTQMIQNATFEEAISRIMNLGFDGVEIGMVNRDFQLREEFFEEGFADKIRACLEQNGVKCWSVGGHMDFTESEEIFSLVKRAIPITRQLGAEVMIINGARRYDDVPFEIQWQKQVASVKELCQIAQDNDVLLAVEFEPGFVVDSTEKFLQLLEDVDSQVLCMNADIGHMFLQDAEPLISIEKCGKHIVHAHLENMKAGIHDHLVPYEGDMDLPLYIRQLKAVGFDGPASLDLYKYDYEAVAEESVKYLKQLENLIILC